VRASVAAVRARRIPPPQLSGILAVAVAAGLVSWLATAGNHASTEVAPLKPARNAPLAPTPPAPASVVIAPVALSAAGLHARARDLGQPMYWIGPRAGVRYELARDAGRNVLLRYLPRGVKAGDKRPLLTVGTYPFEDAYARTRKLRSEKVAVSRTLPDGGFAFYRSNEPTSVYLAYPGVDYQIEVYSPSAAEARRLVFSGSVVPVR
jgi:hypothetical protein